MHPTDIGTFTAYTPSGRVVLKCTLKEAQNKGCNGFWVNGSIKIFL